jgi:LPXTG-motif cell wall-anchored protein
MMSSQGFTGSTALRSVLLLVASALMVLVTAGIVSAQPYNQPNPPGTSVTTGPAVPGDFPAPCRCPDDTEVGDGGGVVVKPVDPIATEVKGKQVVLGEPEPQERAPTALPLTGADLLLYVLVGGGAVMLGVALVGRSRRRAAV